ncbi:MAG TPA: cache domain-containing protein [Chloroflexota bacterium]|nr:cache domain-containing protein [Chloroflexota bacterium]
MHLIARTFQVDALRVAVGLFCLLLGALMLVAPHKLTGLTYQVIRPLAPALGVTLICGGMLLVGITLLRVSRQVFVASHVIAAGPILAGGIGYAVPGLWHSAALSLTMACWTLVASAIPPIPVQCGRQPINALALMLGMSATAVGIAIVAGIALNAPPPSGPVPTIWNGGIFVLAGGVLMVTQVTRLRVTPISRVAKVAPGSIFVAYALLVALPADAMVGVLFFGLFGAALIVQPWVRARQTGDTSSLQAQLAVALLGITVVVITSTISLLGHREERSTVEAQLNVNQALAEALSANVAEYVGHHQQALRALASVPGLAAMSPDEHRALLEATKRAYPDAVTFSTFAPSGAAIARGDGRAPMDSTSDWIPSVAAGAPSSVRASLSTLVGRPVFADATGIRDDQGRIASVATIVLESSHLVDLLDRSSTPGIQAFIVDEAGTVIAHSREEIAQGRPSYARRESVDHLITMRENAGSTIDVVDSQQVLVGFARVEGIGWGWSSNGQPASHCRMHAPPARSPTGS